MGFEINKHGIAPTKEKIEAIKSAQRPTSKKELQAFLGLLNFYHVFLKNRVNVAQPLYELLRNSKWESKKSHDEAFKKVKDLLTSDSVLAHYDPNKETILTCDASPWGVGCVLSQRQSNDVIAPVAYHSVTMDVTQKRYAQLDKEALAIVKGVKKFHCHLFGRK